MEIRIASDRDIEILFDIRTSVRENHQGREELARIGVTPAAIAEMLATTSRAWIGRVDGIDAAFSMADSSRATIFAMFVRPGFEGRGLGRALMDRAESWLWKQGCGEIWLTTGADPAIRANGFYRHLGWISRGIDPDGEIRYVKPSPHGQEPIIG